MTKNKTIQELAQMDRTDFRQDKEDIAIEIILAFVLFLANVMMVGCMVEVMPCVGATVHALTFDAGFVLLAVILFFRN